MKIRLLMVAMEDVSGGAGLLHNITPFMSPSDGADAVGGAPLSMAAGSAQ